MGFVLEPDEAQRLIDKNPRNKDVLFPYLNGEDLNSRPDQSPSRWVINFFDWPLDRDSAPEGYEGPVAADYPDCLAIVEEKVKPESDRLERKRYVCGSAMPQRWWQYAREASRTVSNHLTGWSGCWLSPESASTLHFVFHADWNRFSADTDRCCCRHRC